MEGAGAYTRRPGETQMRMTLLLVPLCLLLAAPLVSAPSGSTAGVTVVTVDSTIAALEASVGVTSGARIRTGVRQVAQRWRAEDGDAVAFTAFCADNFVADPAELTAAFARIERVSEQLGGHLHELRRELTTPLDLDTGEITRIDRLLGDLDVSNHLTDDLFDTKVAFFALLNFPIHTLGERLARGASWDRETWARSRMVDQFADRIPADVKAEMVKAFTAADAYIADYNIRLDRLITPGGARLFPEGLRLISHWGLRDELKTHYGAGTAELARQRMIAKVMERIVRQEIPRVVIDNPDVEWCPETNEVRPLAGAKQTDPTALAAREADVRYARWLDNFRAERRVDPFTPTAPTALARSFDESRQIPENQVEAILRGVLAAPEVKGVAAEIARRIGRPLEPFDIWYADFKPKAGVSEDELDRITQARYPTAAAFQHDVPKILRKLGFSPDKADWLAARIVVDASRGAGHAMGAVRREDKAHLRTRVSAGGMKYKGYNIALHELGHTVEQTFSLASVDHWFLNGPPNTAFTEALAFTFQARDLEVLGVTADTSDSRRNEALGTLWAAYEISGVALMDMMVWNWLYAHADASPAQLREAVLAAAREVWNQYFEPVLGSKDCELLAIYSHTVTNPLYLSDYPLGHIIAYQIGARLSAGEFGREFERMATIGAVTPDLWMRTAVGVPISPEALIAGARAALAAAQ